MGIIGLGVGARHAASFKSHPRCEVAVLCDSSPTKITQLKTVYPHASFVANADELLADPTLDVVSVASYDADHFTQIIQALRADKHVMTEKPLCLDMEQARQIHRVLGERKALVLSAHLPLSGTPRFRELRYDIRQGLYGQLYYAAAAYNYGRLEKITTGWRAEAPYYSVILDGAIHLIDLLLLLANDRVVQVAAAGNRIVTVNTDFHFADCVTGILRFESGLLASVTANFGNVTPHVHLLSLYGTKASFEHDLRGAWRYESRDPGVQPIEIITPYRQERQADTSQIVHSFVEAIVSGTEPAVTSQQIFDSLCVGFALEEAQRTRQWTQVTYL